MSRDFEAAFASTEEVRNQLLLRSVCLLSSVAAFLLDKSFAESSYLSPRSSRAVVGRQVWKEAESTTLRSEFSLSISYFSVQSLKFISNDYEITTSTSRDLHNSPRRLLPSPRLSDHSIRFTKQSQSIRLGNTWRQWRIDRKVLGAYRTS